MQKQKNVRNEGTIMGLNIYEQELIKSIAENDIRKAKKMCNICVKF